MLFRSVVSSLLSSGTYFKTSNSFCNSWSVIQHSERRLFCSAIRMLCDFFLWQKIILLKFPYFPPVLFVATFYRREIILSCIVSATDDLTAICRIGSGLYSTASRQIPLKAMCFSLVNSFHCRSFFRRVLRYFSEVVCILP